MSDEHINLGWTRLRIGRHFGVGGVRWNVTRPDAAGVVQPIATVTPLYVRQIQPSELQRALAESAATLRARWSCTAPAAASAVLKVGDTITSVADGALVFLVTGLDRAESPGVCQGTLQKQEYT